MTKRNGLELTTGIAVLILAVAGTVLFAMSYTTGYYIFGQMQSTIIAVLLGAAIVVEIIALTVRAMLPDAFWPKLLTFAVTAFLAAAAALILGDRVEGIGNCIVTDYDSGHGGEEAIYMSLGGAILMLIAIVYNIIGSFSSDKPAGEKTSMGREIARNVGFGVSTVAVLLAVIIPVYGLVNPAGPGGIPGTPGGSGTYTISFNANNNNADTMPRYQFLPGDLSGMVRADSRLFIDVSLTLDGEGGYTLFSEAYVIEAGERATIGDPTGLGMVLTTTAEGTYVDNGDGTVTTSPATKAAVEMAWDTYSAQMRDATGMNVDGESEGSFDSDAHPVVLNFVPETVWTLGTGTITSYRDANAGGVYKVSFNQNNGNAESMPNYQFLAGDLSGMVRADSRLFIDVTLTLDGSGNYTLFSEAYVIEAGERATIGDPTGLGMVLTMNASGTYTENADGTYTTAVPAHAVFEMAWDTYSAQMRDATGMNVDGETEGTFDSTAHPSVLDFIPETVWTTADGAIVTYEQIGGEQPGGDKPAGDSLVVTSDDGGTTITFNADGTYVFAFAAYGIEDPGTYTYDGTTLTVTNANGDAVTASGDPLKFHYVSAVNEQLAGDFTVNAADLAALLSGGSSGGELVITSDDGGTTMTFRADGTYVFAFAAFGIEDPGTYTYDGTTLTVTNANGDVVTAEGDPLKFHYVSAVNEQLAGDFTVNAAGLSALLSGGGSSTNLTVTSDDGGTTITFNADGTYRFFFETYGLEDLGTYTYDGTTLTVTNANGDVVTATGDPLKFHYVSAINEQLGGDYTVAAADLAAVLNGDGSGASLTVTSDDGGTTITFNADGTYRFFFETYGLEDLGTYTYDGTTLTVTNANGDTVTVTGDPLKFHYVSAINEQLGGDYTVAAADLAAVGNGVGSGGGVTITSDDGGTEITFNADGTYVFAFPSFGVEDPGTYTYDGTTLTITNSAGAVVTAEGDPLKFHYVSGVSDQLTGDFTVPATTLQ